MKLFFYQAECGDATRIEYMGSDEKMHHILIDMGFERTYRQLLKHDISSIINSGNEIDLCIISHIHDDHVGGAIAYIKDIQSGSIGDCVQQWLYNPPRGRNEKVKRRSAEVSDAKSMAQGDILATYLLSTETLISKDVANDWNVDLFGLKLTALSPSQQTLDALRIKYSEVRRKPFEREEWANISLAKAKLKDDYNIPIRDFKLAIDELDQSVENGSSIAVLVEQDGKKYLNLADAHPTVVTGTLQKLGYSSSRPLVCDWVKVAHHGSKINNPSSLYDLIRCNNFIISANGENKYKFPSKQCLATIIRSSQRTDAVCKLYFTYDNATLRSIFKNDEEKIFDELNFSVHFSVDPIMVFES